jgi:PKD repeat protein
LIEEVYANWGSGQGSVLMWGLSPSDNNSQINAYKLAHGITHPCAGTEGGGPVAINTVIAGQQFYGYPTWVVICPDKSMYFDVCWPPPSASCFDPYIQNCVNMGLTAGFTADFTEICQYDAVHFSDQSTGSVTSWNWTFEGGDPESSVLQNPVVTYNNVGVFDVTLEVGDGTNTNTLLIEDYIEVLQTPPVMLIPFDDVCIGWPPFELTGGSPAGGTYSGPGVENGWFDPGSAGLGTHIIQYTFIAMNGCDNSAQETILVDPCTGTNTISQNEMLIWPNPAKDKVTISVLYPGWITIRVLNILGTTMICEKIHADGNFNHSVDLSDLQAGILFLSVETPAGATVNKIVLQK